MIDWHQWEPRFLPSLINLHHQLLLLANYPREMTVRQTAQFILNFLDIVEGISFKVLDGVSP